jgi:hypothetical protein
MKAVAKIEISPSSFETNSGTNKIDKIAVVAIKRRLVLTKDVYYQIQGEQFKCFLLTMSNHSQTCPVIANIGTKRNFVA